MVVTLDMPYISYEEQSTTDISLLGVSDENAVMINDGNYYTYAVLEAGTELKIISDEKMEGIYLEWYLPPSGYKVLIDEREKPGGENAFLHEYIDAEGATCVTLVFEETVFLCDVYGYAENEVPDSVQKWEPVCEKADILVFSTHADDEILFLGGVLAEYAGERELDVQVLYYFDYTETWIVREHEKLDGLWMAGVKHYPDKGSYKEKGVWNLKDCKEWYDYESSLGWLVEKIRRYQPLVCVTQDINGEYGHVHHLMITEMMTEAVNISPNSEAYPESAEKYGAYDVPKTYLHLWPENKIVLDTSKPLENFQGRSGYEVLLEAYKEHVTQQQFPFLVSETNEYSIKEFGLYRSTVGTDTEDDMMENLVSYKEQEEIRLAQEAASIEEASREAASIEEVSSEAASIEEASREAASIEEASREAASIEEASRKAASLEEASRENASIEEADREASRNSENDAENNAFIKNVVLLLNKYYAFLLFGIAVIIVLAVFIVKKRSDGAKDGNIHGENKE